MSQSDLLDTFLQIQRQEGRFFDSSAFSIDSVKALQKLGQYQLADSGLWLVKLVQAAVACQAPQVEIRFGRRQVEVAFSAPPEWQADAILETVVSGVLSKDRALRHLVTGIRACASSPNEAMTWSCGEAVVDLQSSACRIHKQPGQAYFHLIGTRPSRSRSMARTLSSSLTQLSKQTVEEHDALMGRCWVCPIPLVVDGKRLPTGLDKVTGGHIERDPVRALSQRRRKGSYQISACLGLRYFDGPASLAGLSVPAASELPTSGVPYAFSKPVYRDGTFLRWSPKSQESQAAVALVAGPTATSQIHFVHDGAVVHSHPLPELTIPPPGFAVTSSGLHPPLAVRLFFPVSDEQLDLSGFALRDVAVDRMVGDSLRPTLELASAVAANYKSFSYIPQSRTASNATNMIVGGGAALATLVTYGLAFPFLSTGALLFHGVNRMQWRSQALTMVVKLVERLEANISAGKSTD